MFLTSFCVAGDLLDHSSSFASSSPFSVTSHIIAYFEMTTYPFDSCVHVHVRLLFV